MFFKEAFERGTNIPFQAGESTSDGRRRGCHRRSARLEVSTTAGRGVSSASRECCRRYVRATGESSLRVRDHWYGTAHSMISSIGIARGRVADAEIKPVGTIRRVVNN